MSRHKKNKNSKTTILKFKDRKNKKRIKRCSSNNNKKNELNNEKDKNQKKQSNSSVTVSKLRVPCRRYEEYHEHFLEYNKILEFLRKIQKNNSSAVELVNIGNSTQGKPICMVLISTNICNIDSPKMAVLIEAGLNGENAVAVSNALYMIDYLTKNPNFIKIMDYYIIPCSNPDAYDEFIKKKNKDNNNNKTCCSTSSLNKNKSKCSFSKSAQNCKTSTSDKNNTKKNSSTSLGSSQTDTKKSVCDNFEHTNAENTGSYSLRSKCKEKDNNKKDLRKKSYTKDKNSASSKKNSEASTTFARPCAPATPKANQETKKPAGVDLTFNFPVVLGLNDMKRIPTNLFLEKIKTWKENYLNQSPETMALIRTIYNYQFTVKMLISLQEGGETICYPYGFCAAISDETDDLIEIAKKGKFGINGRNFQYGSIYDIHGLTFGSLIDFLKVDRCSIKYTYILQVHKKTPRYNEQDELKQLMRYGGEVMECVKRMSCAVFKRFTEMTGKKQVQVESSKPAVEKNYD